MFRLQNRVRVRVKVLGLGFRDRVRIHNIIGGAAGAHISMTSYTFTHVWFGRPQDACDNMAVEGSLSSGKADNEVSGEVEKHTLKEYFTLEGTY